MLLSCGGSSGSGAVPSPSPGFALESIVVADGAPPSPTPTPSVTPKVTPSATPKPTAMPTTIPAAGATIGFNAQGTFVKGKNTTELLDITTSPSTLWTSSDPTVLGPNGDGNYTALKTGCACVLASNSNVTSNLTLIGVVTPFSSCPACTPVIVSRGSSNGPKTSAPTSDAAAAEPVQSAGVLMWTFDAGAELAGQIAVGANNSAYFITRDGVLNGLDSSGKEILHRRADGNSPVVTATGSVIAKSSATELAAFGIDGATLWHVEIGAGGGPLEDPDAVNHLNWYLTTGFKRPYPGEKTVRPPSDFFRLTK